MDMHDMIKYTFGFFMIKHLLVCTVITQLYMISYFGELEHWTRPEKKADSFGGNLY